MVLAQGTLLRRYSPYAASDRGINRDFTTGRG